MLPANNITDEHIALAEKILLPQGKKFDQERVDFIKDLNTGDLHAVPGSGKTTALLAKLISLEQQLPLKGGRGILVVSHTNTAVNELRDRIGNFCPRLFAYPNFVGTIQSFTDTFLCIPYYKQQYKKAPVRIDDEIYNEHHIPDFAFKSFLKRRNDGNKLLYDYRLKGNDELVLKFEYAPFVFASHTQTYQKILKIKRTVREQGFLSFDEAYMLAEEYLQKYPDIKNIIRKRFQYVFVDEMQDMSRQQFELLEQLFANTPEIVFQRIGDNNQGIYDGDSIVAGLWKHRNKKKFSGSHRLTPHVATIVESLAVEPLPILGLQKNEDGTDIEIMPIMLVFDDKTIGKVIEKFADFIQELIDKGKLNPLLHNTYKAIGWRKEADNPKLCIPIYHPPYSTQLAKLTINYDCLESYLHYFDGNIKTLASLRKGILNGILKTLRLEEVVHPITSRTFSKSTLINYLEETNEALYKNLKLKVYEIATLVMQKKLTDGLALLKALASDVLKEFGKRIFKSKTFVITKHPFPHGAVEQTPTHKNNCYKKGDVEIDVTTVHSVKGQTHNCTLYIETFYERDIQKKGQHESTRIADQLQGIALPNPTHDVIKQTLKMTYVGFSRPTHLLCFAVHHSRFQESYQGKPNLEKWDVRFLKGEPHI